MPVNEAPPIPLGTVLRDKWRLDSVLGAGGMGTVFAATHRNGMRGAIKVLHPELSRRSDVRARFLREGYVANKIEHSGIVRVLDDDETEDGHCFLVMELLEGEGLKDRWVRAKRKLPVMDVITVADAVLDILEAAHRQGVVHRDIKPDNVFLTRDGAIKLLDFGIARLKESQGHLTVTGATLGTPAFMAPEQALAHWQQVDARSDLFAVGAMMWTMLSGRLLHTASTAPELLVAAATKQAAPFETVAPHVPAPVAAVIDRAVAFDRDARWPDAATMRAALEDARRQLLARPTVRMDAAAAAAGAPRGHLAKTAPLTPLMAATHQATQVTPAAEARSIAWLDKTQTDEPMARSVHRPAAPARRGHGAARWLLAATGLIVVGAGLGLAGWMVTSGGDAPSPASAASRDADAPRTPTSSKTAKTDAAVASAPPTSAAVASSLAVPSATGSVGAVSATGPALESSAVPPPPPTSGPVPSVRATTPPPPPPPPKPDCNPLVWPRPPGCP